MTEFLEALGDPTIPFLRYALIVGLLASVSLGIVGSYVVTRRISYLAAAISHCVFGGIGAGFYLQEVIVGPWLQAQKATGPAGMKPIVGFLEAVGIASALPMYAAVASALMAAVTIGLVSLYARQREDTVIGAIWVAGMAVGLLLLSKAPANVDPMSYLFGDILLISPRDVWIVAVLDVLVVAVGVLFYNKLLAICFDEQFAELRGVRVKFYYLLLLCLTALTVVLLVRVVGIVLVIALVTLPAAVAGNFSRRLWQMMALAVLFCMAFVALGLAASYPTDLPSGPTIVVLAGLVYLAVALGSRLARTKTA